MDARGIDRIAAVEPDRPALICDGVVTTYGQLDRGANDVAHRLADAGIGHGDRVAVQLTNRPEVFVAWNGAARVGALVVPVGYRLAPAEARYLLDDSGARAFIHADAATASTITDGLDLALRLDVADIGERDAPPTETFLGSPVVWMNYTSGTTGKPKGIRRDPPPALRDAPPQPFAQFWGFDADSVHLLSGPAYHTAPGAYAQMNLVEGGTVVIMRPFDAEEALRLIDAHGVTSSHMVPANFVRILELDDEVRGRYELSSVQRIIHAAAPCPIAVKRRIIEVFPAGSVWEYYGASEGMGTIISPQEWLAHPGSVGKPFPGLDIRILGDDGEPLPPGEIGRIYLKAMTGFEFAYHEAPDKTAEAWRDGVFTVGDLGHLDEDGYLYIADRRTDLILRGGVNVYPAEIEAALAELDEVVDAAVYGIPDERIGARVHAVIEPAPGAAPTLESIRSALTDLLADYKRPESIELVATLPREPNGKVNKRALREKTLANR